MFAGHRADDRLDCRPIEIDILGVAARSLETHDAVRGLDHIVRHSLHHDPVDVRDLVVAVVNGVQGPDPGWNMAMNMKSEFVRLGDACGQPRRVERSVELNPSEAVGLRFVHELYGFSLAGSDIGNLRGVRPFPIDERGRINVREQQLARGRAAPAIDRAFVVVAGIADRSHTHRQLLQPGEVIADMHVAVPEAGDQGPAAALDDAGAGGNGDRSPGADRGNHAVIDNHGLVDRGIASRRRRRAERPGRPPVRQAR